MDRRKFLLTGGSVVGTVGAVGTIGSAGGLESSSTLSSTLDYAKRARPAGAESSVQASQSATISSAFNSAPRAVAGQANPTQRFQLAYLAHGSVGRASLNRVPLNVPFALVFRGFGARANHSELAEVRIDAGYYAPDASVLKHRMWAHTEQYTSSNVRINVARDNFIGFFASHQSINGNAGADLYPFNTDLPLEYGSYILAARSASTGQFPSWADYVYSGDINHPLLNTTNPSAALDFDYLSYSITRSGQA